MSIGCSGLLIASRSTLFAAPDVATSGFIGVGSTRVAHLLQGSVYGPGHPGRTRASGREPPELAHRPDACGSCRFAARSVHGKGATFQRPEDRLADEGGGSDPGIPARRRPV